jgi:hypothetical protein
MSRKRISAPLASRGLGPGADGSYQPHQGPAVRQVHPQHRREEDVQNLAHPRVRHRRGHPAPRRLANEITRELARLRPAGRIRQRGVATLAVMRLAFWRLKSEVVPRTFGPGALSTVVLGALGGVAAAAAAFVYLTLPCIFSCFRKRQRCCAASMTRHFMPRWQLVQSVVRQLGGRFEVTRNLHTLQCLVFRRPRDL